MYGANRDLRVKPVNSSRPVRAGKTGAQPAAALPSETMSAPPKKPPANPAAPTIRQVPLADLHEHPQNPRSIRPQRLDDLKRALAEDPAMLEVRPLIALPDGTVIAGNQRLRAARELGWSSIPTAVVELDDETARLWMLRDNNPYGEWDEAAVAELLSGIPSAEVALAGFGASEVDRLLAGIALERPDADDAPPVPAVPRSKLGEVYELGPHRLMCGDATDPEVVAELMAGHSAALLLTDPPYGTQTDHRWREAAGKSRLGTARGAIQGDDRNEWTDAYAATDAPVAYVWHSSLHGASVAADLAAAGFDIRQQIVWVKAVFAIGRAAYQWKHETCWYAVRHGVTPRWLGGRSQSTVWEAPSPIHIFGGGNDDTRTPHPTQKPVAITTPPIENHTGRADIVYDPFAGSGTTLIACEQLGRRCFAMELDEGYCDVIRDRYAAFTAQ